MHINNDRIVYLQFSIVSSLKIKFIFVHANLRFLEVLFSTLRTNLIIIEAMKKLKKINLVPYIDSPISGSYGSFGSYPITGSDGIYYA